VFAAAVAYLLRLYGDPSDIPAGVVAAALLAAAGLAGAYMMLRRTPAAAVAGGVGLGLLGHAALAAGLAPRLTPLWLSSRVERALGRAELLPSQGLADAPVTVAGYAEPSLVFELGTDTVLGDGADAAEAIAEHRPAVVEQRQQAAFEAALAAERATAVEVAAVKGLDYSDGHKMTLRIYRAPEGPDTLPGDSRP
jgi:hypothetical protein